MSEMSVKQLINLLKEMDPNADVCLAIDKFDKKQQEWESELISLNVEDLLLGNTYAAFQVPKELLK